MEKAVVTGVDVYITRSRNVQQMHLLFREGVCCIRKFLVLRMWGSTLCCVLAENVHTFREVG